MTYRVPKVNTCFKAGLLCLIIKTIFSTSKLLPVTGIADDLLALAGCVLLFCSVFKKGCRPSAYCVYFVVLALAAYTSYRMGNLRMLLIAAICVASTRQNVHRIIRFMFFYETLFLAFHVLLALATSVLGRYNFISVSGEMKYTFGFGHPNTFSCLLMNILLMWSWMNYHRLRMQHILIQILIVLFFYVFTGTRTILLSIFIFAALFVFVKKSRKDLHLLVRYLIPLAVVCHMVVIPLYIGHHPLAELVNKLLSNRIKLGGYWYAHKGLSAFGQNLMSFQAVWDDVWQMSGSLTFDNIYTCLAINFGMVWLAVLCVLFYRISFLRDVKVNLFLVMWALYGVTEVHGVNPVMLFPLLLLTCDVRENPAKETALVPDHAANTMKTI
ncbi:MAG: hypothetical protein IKU34_00635 [Clostridia bacterium]|nr:hypothetical protein [Clostridia bacterium]